MGGLQNEDLWKNALEPTPRVDELVFLPNGKRPVAHGETPEEETLLPFTEEQMQLQIRALVGSDNSAQQVSHGKQRYKVPETAARRKVQGSPQFTSEDTKGLSHADQKRVKEIEVLATKLEKLLKQVHYLHSAQAREADKLEKWLCHFVADVARLDKADTVFTKHGINPLLETIEEEYPADLKIDHDEGEIATNILEHKGTPFSGKIIAFVCIQRNRMIANWEEAVRLIAPTPDDPAKAVLASVPAERREAAYNSHEYKRKLDQARGRAGHGNSPSSRGPQRHHGRGQNHRGRGGQRQGHHQFRGGFQSGNNQFGRPPPQPYQQQPPPLQQQQQQQQQWTPPQNFRGRGRGRGRGGRGGGGRA